MFLWYVKKENPSEECSHAQLRPGNSACNACDVTLNKAKVLTKKEGKPSIMAFISWQNLLGVMQGQVLSNIPVCSIFCFFVSIHEVQISSKLGLVYHFDLHHKVC